MAKLTRYNDNMRIVLKTLALSSKDLLFLVFLFLIGAVLYGTLMFYVEYDSTFPSIPHGMWWAALTMTTVGYGDCYPTVSTRHSIH